MLGHGADLSTVTILANLMNTRFSPLQMVQAMASTPEYRIHQVQETYTRILHRPPDALGLKSSVAFLARGGTE
jgi:hypothetical protein